MKNHYDVIVIGAGPSGSVAAAKLLKEGKSVLVLEKMVFPRFVIGESLLPHIMDYLDDLDKVTSAPFSALLEELLEQFHEVPDLGPLIRQIALRIVHEKRYFALHADPLSQLLYDLQFWLYRNCYPVNDEESYLQVYCDMIAFAKGFGTGGYAPDFIRDWFRARLAGGQMRQAADGLVLTPAYRAQLLEQLSGFRPISPDSQEQP